MRYRPGNKTPIVVVASVLVLAGCSSRSADDRVRPQTPLQPATPVAAMPTHFVAVTVPRERYQLRGNTLYVTRGSEVVYVVPQGVTHTNALAQLRDQDLHLHAYLHQLKTDQEVLRETLGLGADQSPVEASAPATVDPQRGLRRMPQIEAADAAGEASTAPGAP